MDQRLRTNRLAKERWVRAISRKRKKQELRASQARTEKSDPVVYRSKILDLFGVPFVRHKKRHLVGPKTFRLPGTFSLTANPEEALKAIRSLVQYARDARRPRVILDHRFVTTLGLGAEALLAVILKEISLEGQSCNGAYVRGYKPQSANVRKMMDEVGCVRVLRSGADEDIKVSLQSTAKVFRHQNRGKDLSVDALTADPISVTTKEFSDHLDSCLGLVGRKLSAKGRDRLLSYVAEVLINAQEHSETAQWTIVGFVDQEDAGLIYRAAIFSLGSTIAETFNKLPEDSYSLKVVQPYIERHKTAGFFSGGWNKDDLLAVIALQGNVSSKLDGPASDRGQGTVDLIEFFQDVSNECSVAAAKPVMSILSGGTHIKFDGTYRMKYESGIDRMVIAFNQDNNLLVPPDPSAVRELSGASLPGVMISIAVPLASSTVEEPMESNDEN